MSETSAVLGRIRTGQAVLEELLPLVYDDLRHIAAERLAREKPGHTLEATGLVHEAYLRLGPGQHFDSRGHFFAAAAEAMRRILVESARRKKAVKHGGGLQRHDAASLPIAAPERGGDLLAVDEALDQLAVADPTKAELVKLRYFAGLTLDETAEVLGVSVATVKRRWEYCRAWLFERISSTAGNKVGAK